ncbi:MAG: 3-hydroxyacyl-CoA dehydrogenase family protein [Paracoccaceae bacterium]
MVQHLGKTAAPAEDFPAFIVNRILIPMINEAGLHALRRRGLGAVDRPGDELGANRPMGPFELADFISLDTCLAIMNVLYDGLADTKYRPCPLLTKPSRPAGWAAASTITGATCRCPRADLPPPAQLGAAPLARARQCSVNAFV